eukprot:scaffold22303_cov80-Skeletonema_menzelii.AAC.1
MLMIDDLTNMSSNLLPTYPISKVVCCMVPATSSYPTYVQASSKLELDLNSQHSRAKQSYP